MPVYVWLNYYIIEHWCKGTSNTRILITVIIFFLTGISGRDLQNIPYSIPVYMVGRDWSTNSKHIVQLYICIWAFNSQTARQVSWTWFTIHIHLEFRNTGKFYGTHWVARWLTLSVRLAVQMILSGLLLLAYGYCWICGLTDPISVSLKAGRSALLLYTAIHTVPYQSSEATWYRLSNRPRTSLHLLTEDLRRSPNSLPTTIHHRPATRQARQGWTKFNFAATHASAASWTKTHSTLRTLFGVNVLPHKKHSTYRAQRANRVGVNPALAFCNCLTPSVLWQWIFR